MLVDGGMRGGADVVKALALGADAVLLGRPYVYALAVGGEAGVAAVIEQFAAETDLTLALMGGTVDRRARRDVDRGVVLTGSGAVRARGDRASTSRRRRGGSFGSRRAASAIPIYTSSRGGWGHPLAGPARARGRRLGRGRRRRRRARRAGRPRRARLAHRRAASARCACVGARQCKRRPVPPARLRRRDGTVLSPVLAPARSRRAPSFTRPRRSGCPIELPAEQACLIGCAVATGVVSVLETAACLGGSARGRDRLRRGRSVCGAGRAARRCRGDLRDRPRRAKAGAARPSARRIRRRARARLRLRRRRAAGDGRSRPSRCSATAGTLV